MNILQCLNKMGLIENTHFTLIDDQITMLPIQVESVIDGEIVINETTPSAPTLEQLQDVWKDIQLEPYEMASLVNLYLSDKSNLRDPENDELNITNNKIFRWNFTNIPKPTKDQLLALAPSLTANISKSDKLKQIEELEKQITPRRVREAILTGDITLIMNIDNQIQQIRATLG
jgi:hypothetical protein